MRTRNLLSAVLVGFVLIFSFRVSLFAQIVEGPPHLVNLYLYYDYDETDLDVMRPALEEASRLLYNATNGQMQIGAVRVSNRSTYRNRADLWIEDGAGGASAYVGGYGVPGLYMTFYRNRHRWIAEDGPLGTERGQFGINHEMGHYVFNLYDEYRGGDVGNPYCLQPVGGVFSEVACIMDGGTTVIPKNRRTEYCTDESLGLITDHWPHNDQHSYRGESCWETMADYVDSEYGVTIDMPTADNPPDTDMPDGHNDIAWIVVGDELHYSLCVDKSYSMAGSKMALAKVAANLFVDLVHEGASEYLGVVAFSDNADIEFPIEEVVDDDVKTDARTAIGSISVVNNTAMGDGMRQSYNQITSLGAADNANIEVIVLLSDGVHNHGAEDPEDVIPDLRTRGVRVFTVGLGDPDAAVYPLDAEALQEIADLTGGFYRHAPAEAELPGIYAEYAAEVRGDDIAMEATDYMAYGAGETSKEKEAYIDAFSREATFVLHWPLGYHYFELRLRKPDGTIISPSDAATDPRVKYIEQPNYEFYRIQQPEAGNWKLLVSMAPEGERQQEEQGEDKAGMAQYPKKGRFTTQVLASSASVDFGVAAQQLNFSYPLVPVIRAAVYAGGPVAGAMVNGVVTGPDGNRYSISLYDDGDWSHGDHRANDGIYSNRFMDFDKNGSYRLNLRAVNKNGQRAIPDEPPFDQDFPGIPVDPFERVTNQHFTVVDVPDQLPEPRLFKLSPNRLRKGGTGSIRIRGENFMEGANVAFSDPDIRIRHISFVSADELQADIEVLPTATGGFSDVTVVNPGGRRAVLADGFQVVGGLYPFGLSLHGGYTMPHGALATDYNSGLSAAIDIEYRLTSSLSLELLGGYHAFTADNPALDDTYWLNFALNGKFYFTTTPNLFFANVAPGAYLPERGATEFGLMAGGGLYRRLNPHWVIEAAYNHHAIFTGGDNTRFSTGWLGVKYRF